MDFLQLVKNFSALSEKEKKEASKQTCKFSLIFTL